MHKNTSELSETAVASVVEQAAAVHAKVLPMALARLITAPLTYPGKNIEPYELVAWARPELTDRERAEILREAAIRLRPKARLLESRHTGVKIPESAAWRLHGADAQALHDLRLSLGERDLEGVTFAEAAEAWPGRSEGLWRLLALVEGLDWVPPPHDDEWARAAAGTTPRQRAEKRDAAQRLSNASLLPDLSGLDDGPLSAEEFAALSRLHWLPRLDRHDMRLGGHAALSQQLTGLRLDTLNGMRGAPALARRLLQVDGMPLIEEMREAFRCIVTNALTRTRPAQVAQWMGILECRYLSPAGDGHTLEEVGQRFNLTRERVRQVCDKALSKGLIGPILLPVLGRELDRVKRALPVRVSEANESLGAASGGQVGIESLINVARLLGTKVAFDVQDVKLRLDGELTTVSMLQHAEALESTWPKRAIAISRGSIGYIGCASIVYVAGMMVLEAEPPPDAAALEGALEAVPGFRWLDKGKTWFTFGDAGADGLMARRVRKLLAVAKYEPRTDEVLEALVTDDLWFLRDNKRLGFPPVHVLREVFASWPWIRLLQSNRVASVEPVGLGALDPTERALFEVIEEQGGFALTQEIEQGVIERAQVSRIRVHQMLGTTPIVRRVEHAVYGLAASPINAEALLAARERQQIRLRRHQAGDTESHIRLTAGCLRNGQVTTPAWLEARFPSGVVPVIGSDVPLKLGAKNQMRGFLRILRGAEEGDLMHLEWVPPHSIRLTLEKGDPERDAGANVSSQPS